MERTISELGPVQGLREESSVLDQVRYARESTPYTIAEWIIVEDVIDCT